MASNAPQGPPSNKQRAQNFLVYGFLLSVALHLLIGPFVKFQKTQVEEEKVSVIKRDVIPTPPPTPPPTPKPTPTPPPTPPPKETPPPEKHTPQPEQPKIKINTAKTTATKGTGSEAANTHTQGSVNGVPQGTSTAQATAAPTAAATAAPATPTPTPTPSCANPNVEPRTVNAVPPDIPPIAAQQGITGTVTVQISLDATSKITAAKIVKTPSAVLNNAALQAARNSTFKTEVRNCLPVAADYLFIEDFTSE